MNVTPFAREVKRLRAEHGLTVRTLATRLDKSVAYVGKIESQGEVPSPEVIRDLAMIFGEDVGGLLDLAKQSLLSWYERDLERKYALPTVTRSGESGSTSRISNIQRKGAIMAKVVSLINMKGGVGKTTLAMQLAHAADKADVRVLAIDLDPQANLSQALMKPRDYVAHLRARKPLVDHIFDGYVAPGTEDGAPRRVEINNVIVKGVGYWRHSTLDLIPSRLELARTVRTLPGKERRLAKALSQVRGEYELIIIDCAPTDSALTDAAYFASQYVLVPIKPEFMATIGLPLLARSLQEFRDENEDHEISIAGLVFNHSSSYTSGPEGQRSIREVTDFAGKIDPDSWKEEEWYVCDNQVRYSASYAKSAREGTPIAQTSYVRDEVSEGFRKLKDEIFGIIGLTRVTA
jgi:chromosome partitioning protein